jgi:hypothetical protein
MAGFVALAAGAIVVVPPQLADAAATPSPPILQDIGDYGSYNSVVWNSDRSITGGVNIYRNDRYVASVSAPSNVFNDFAGSAGDRYYAVAYSSENVFSNKSSEKAAVGFATNVKVVKWSSDVAKVTWSVPDGFRGTAEIYRDGERIGGSHTYRVDRGIERKNPVYTIRLKDSDGNHGPLSDPSKPLTAVRNRSGNLATPGQPATFSIDIKNSNGDTLTYNGTTTVSQDADGVTVEQSGTVSFNGEVSADFSQTQTDEGVRFEVNAHHGSGSMVSKPVPADPTELQVLGVPQHWVGDLIEPPRRESPPTPDGDGPDAPEIEVYPGQNWPDEQGP